MQDVQRRNYRLEHLVTKRSYDVLLLFAPRRESCAGPLHAQGPHCDGPSCYALSVCWERTTTVSACSSSTSARQMSKHLLTVPGRCFRLLLTRAAQKGAASLRGAAPPQSHRRWLSAQETQAQHSRLTAPRPSRLRR